jgi:cell wall integrity and stress response component
LLTGLKANVPSYGGSSDGGSSSGPSSVTSPTGSTPTGTRTHKGGKTVITNISPGKTVVVTKAPESAAASTADAKSGGSTNVAGIAAGVVVGVAAVTGIIAGIFFYLRHRRRQEAEEEYKRTQVSDFMRGGERKPPGTGYSQMSDSRLDPEAGARRNSHGSIADNQDYSRRILRVSPQSTLVA